MGKTSRLFTVITGDLTGSRTIADRDRFGRKMRAVLSNLSRKYRDELYAPLALTRGIDELGAVLKHPAVSYRLCRTINALVYPRQLRFAIVRGKLDVAVNSRQTGKMDGPAFHVAADLINKAKKKNLYYVFSLGIESVPIEVLLDELANMSYILTAGLTKRQREVVELYRKCKRQTAVARRLNVTQQAVSDALRAAHFRQLQRAETVVDDFLKKVDDYKLQALYSPIQG